MSVKDLPDYEARKWLAQNILGLDEPPELDPKALEKLSGMLSGLFEGEIDAVQLIKEVRAGHCKATDASVESTELIQEREESGGK